MEANENAQVLKVTLNEETFDIDQNEAVRLIEAEKELNRLNAEILGLAKEENQSVFQFLQELKNQKTENHLKGLVDACGGNEETARYIISLEKDETEGEFFGEKDLKEFYPNLNTEDLPECVKENSKNFNTNILDEYLRFKARNEIEKQSKEAEAEIYNNTSVGSMRSVNTNEMSPERYEFLKGLWG